MPIIKEASNDAKLGGINVDVEEKQTEKVETESTDTTRAIESVDTPLNTKKHPKKNKKVEENNKENEE